MAPAAKIIFFILIYIQQDTKLHSLFYLETALHVSGSTTNHHQERIQLYLQHLVFVTPLLLSVAIVEELEPVWACCGTLHSTTFCGFFVAQRPLVSQGLLSIEVSRSHSDTPLSRTPLEVWLARGREVTLTINSAHKRQISMPRRDSDPQFQQESGRKTHVLDRAAIGIFKIVVIKVKFCFAMTRVSSFFIIYLLL